MTDARKEKKYSKTIVISIPRNREDMFIDKQLANKLGIEAPFILTPDNFSKEREEMLFDLLNNIDDKSRIYICVHGDEKGLYLGSQTTTRSKPEWFAKLLVDAGLKTAKRICLIACKADALAINELDSFAKKFHHTLGEKYDVYVELSAYSQVVGIFSNTKYPAFLGRKIISPDGSMQKETEIWAKDSGFKRIYTWEKDEFGELEQVIQLAKNPINSRLVQDDLKKIDEGSERRNRK